jgi:hypothetical protein
MASRSREQKPRRELGKVTREIPEDLFELGKE